MENVLTASFPAGGVTAKPAKMLAEASDFPEKYLTFGGNDDRIVFG